MKSISFLGNNWKKRLDLHTVKYSNEHLETACCPPWRWCWDEVCVGWWPSLLASGPWARSNCAPSSSEPSDCRELPSCSPVKRRPNLSKTCQLFKIKHNSSYLFTLKLQIFSTLTTFRRGIVKIGDLIRFNFKWLILIRFHSNLPHLKRRPHSTSHNFSRFLSQFPDF